MFVFCTKTIDADPPTKKLKPMEARDVQKGRKEGGKKKNYLPTPSPLSSRRESALVVYQKIMENTHN